MPPASSALSSPGPTRAAAIARGAFDELPDAVILADVSLSIVEWSAMAEQVFGYCSAEAVGMSLASLCRPDVRAAASARVLDAVREGTRFFGEVPCLRKGAEEISVELSAKAAFGARAVLLVARDVTHRARPAREEWSEPRRADDISQLLARERVAREDAEAANRTKDEFLATVSHELRTPLNAILGWTRMLRADQLTREKRTQALATIERNALAQTRLIEDLLDVSRIVAGKLRLEMQPVDLATLIHGALDAVRPAVDAKQIELAACLDTEVSCVQGDPARLQQVIWNLVSNAIKFTPRKGHVVVSLRRGRGGIELAVADTGDGISADFLPYVFERFRQADGTATRPHNGLGIGLALVKSIVELHGGSVCAESEGVARGAQFIVTLPHEPTPAKAR